VVAQHKGLMANAWLAWAVAAVLLVVGLAAGAFSYFWRAPEDTKAIRFSITLPETWKLRESVAASNASPAPLAVSPDGQRVAFVATGADGKNLLWIRSLDAPDSQPLAGTDDAASPFWSPDSRFLAFFAGGKLRKLDVTGGPPITLCDAPTGQGGAWSKDGVIVFEAVTSGNAPLQKVPAAGGMPAAATVLAEGEVRHQRPFFLPDGRHFLYEMEPGRSIYVASLYSSERKLLLNSDSSNVVYSQGHLLFVRETTLMAQPFDAGRLELMGEAFPIAEQVQRHAVGEPLANFSASENGVLVYQTGAAASGTQLTWFDRTGKQIGVLGEPAQYGDVRLSPDEKRVAVTIPSGGTRDIWVYDVARGVKTRFTFDTTEERAPIWSPDSSRIVVNSNRKGIYNLYLKSASGAGTEAVLLEDNVSKTPLNWSEDGQFLLYRTDVAPYDFFVLPLSGERKPAPYTQTPFSENNGRFSPDGRWVAYTSNESGEREEIYVAPFPGPGGKWQVSSEGGLYPQWSRDGTEIFYLAADNRLMTAAVNGKGESFEVGAIKSLFQTRAVIGRSPPHNVSADGKRFLINIAPEQAAESVPITVVVNWTAGVNK
jgi:Tol biopolymer transport system component